MLENLDDRQWLEPPDNEAEKVFECDLCGDDICEGYEYFKVGNDKYCENCVDQETAELPDVEEYFDDI